MDLDALSARYEAENIVPKDGNELAKEMADLGAARYMTVHHSRFCLSRHSYAEPLENAKRAAAESGKPVLMPQMGEVVLLD